MCKVKRSRIMWLVSGALALLIVVLVGGIGQAQTTGTTTRVSVASDGVQGNKPSIAPSISSDGRFVTFQSGASNLVESDTNGLEDIFVHDRETGLTTRVSVASDGTQGNGSSGEPSISADGRFVTFYSIASNLVENDTNGNNDIFVHDRETGLTTRVSVASDGTQADNHSFHPSISADGRFVAFYSSASNLVEGDTNGLEDIFVHDRETGLTTRVSVASDGVQGNKPSIAPSISSDGRFVTFQSGASNLVENDTNESGDIFVHDRETGLTTRVSVASDGTQADNHSSHLSISADGRFVTFYSIASNLVENDTNERNDIFVYDRETGLTTRVSVASDGTQGNNGSAYPSISADGRFVTYPSSASNLVENDTNESNDIFVHDRETGLTTRVSVASDGTQGNNNGSVEPSISADGRFVAFESTANNLVEGDTNSMRDVFVRDRGEGSVSPTTISGKVQSWNVESEEFLPVQGVTISAGSATAISQADGTYSLEVEEGQSYTLQPSLADGDLFWPQVKRANSGDSIVNFIYLGGEDDDADGDAIPNGWEVNGRTVEEDGKTYFLDLPSMGASPIHKDMFVEIDWMQEPIYDCFLFYCRAGTSFKPSEYAIDMVRKAFRQSPIKNPDMAGGITLHVDLGSETVMVSGISWGDLSRANFVVYRQYFVSPSIYYSDEAVEQAFQLVRNEKVSIDQNPVQMRDNINFTPERRGVFHYVLFGDKLGTLVKKVGDTSGVCDEIVEGFDTSLSTFAGNIFMTVSSQEEGDVKVANTFMHELGHSLGLGHGGIVAGIRDNTNLKPNYLSIMNYTIGNGILKREGQRFEVFRDYSRYSDLLPLYELDLNETIPLSSNQALKNYWSGYFCVANRELEFREIKGIGNRVDWDCDKQFTSGVQANLNPSMFVGFCDEEGNITEDKLDEKMIAVEDWHSLDFGAVRTSLDSVKASEVTLDNIPPEISLEAFEAITYPFEMSISGGGSYLVVPDTVISDTVVVSNDGTQVITVTLLYTDTQGWFSVPIQEQVELVSGEKIMIPVNISVPSDAVVNAQAELEFLASVENVSGLSDRAVYTVKVVNQETIQTLSDGEEVSNTVFLPLVVR